MNTTPGTRLRHLRELLGFAGRQQEFAAAIGLTQQSISNMERGKTEPAAKSLNKLFAAFPQVNLAWLVTGAGEPLAGAVLSRPVPVPLLMALPEPPAHPATHPAPPADLVAQFLALLSEREAALEKKHKTVLNERARQAQYTIERMMHQTARMEEELYYLRGVLGHRAPTPQELEMQRAQTPKPAKKIGLKHYDESDPQALEMAYAPGPTALPRLRNGRAMGVSLLSYAA